MEKRVSHLDEALGLIRVGVKILNFNYFDTITVVPPDRYAHLVIQEFVLRYLHQWLVRLVLPHSYLDNRSCISYRLRLPIRDSSPC